MQKIQQSTLTLSNTHLSRYLAIYFKTKYNLNFKRIQLIYLCNKALKDLNRLVLNSV